MRVRNIITAFNVILFLLNLYWYWLMIRGTLAWLAAFFKPKKD